MGHTHLASDLRWHDTLLEQIRGTHTTLLHRPKITPQAYSFGGRPCRMHLAGNP